MSSFFIYWIGIVFVTFFLFLIWYYWNGRVSFLSHREKSSGFECGFDGKGSVFLPFSLRFFLLLLLFLVFDIELTLLLQVPGVVGGDLWRGGSVYLIGFLLILGFILEEFRRGLLTWVS